MPIVATKEKRWAARYPEFGTGPLSTSRFLSEQYFERERDSVFRKCWLQVCHADDIPKPGDFYNRHIQICNAHILLTRDDNGEIRAFHNICGHRCNKLVWAERGRQNHHVCKFHGWVYDNNGQLRSVPDEANFFDLDKDDLALRPVAVDVWQGLVFVNLDPNPTQTLKEYLCGIDEHLDGFPFHKLTLGYAYKGNLNCNWKIAVDSQQEAYHAVHLHRRTQADILTTAENPFLHLLDISFFGPHRMLSIPGNMKVMPPPSAKVVPKLGWAYKERDDVFLASENAPLGINPARADDWLFDIYLIFPNLWLGFFNGAFQTHNFWPLGIDSMYQEIRLWTPKPDNVVQRFALEQQKIFNRDAWLEDFSTLEQTQAVLKSGGRDHYVLKDEEILIRHFHKILDERVGYDAHSGKFD